VSRVLVDSNVLLDVLTEDPQWFEWSAAALAELADAHVLVINPIIFAEVSIGFTRIEDLDAALPPDASLPEPLPWPAGFLAGKCFLRYREHGGQRRSPHPRAAEGLRSSRRHATRLASFGTAALGRTPQKVLLTTGKGDQCRRSMTRARNSVISSIA
jgi:hypothetical protein